MIFQKQFHGSQFSEFDSKTNAQEENNSKQITSALGHFRWSSWWWLFAGHTHGRG